MGWDEKAKLMLFFIMSKGFGVFCARLEKIVPFAFVGLKKSVNFEAHYIKIYGQKVKKIKENPPSS